MAWRAMAGSILAGWAVDPGTYRPVRWVAAGCWAVGHTDTGSGADEAGSAIGAHGWGFGEDEHVFVDDQMGWLPVGSCLAGLGELPERRPRHQPPMSDRGVQGQDVLQIPKSGLVGELHGGGREIVQATGAAGILGHGHQQPTGAQQLGAASQDLSDPRSPALAAGAAEVGWVAGVVEGVFGAQRLAGPPGWLVDHPGVARIGW